MLINLRNALMTGKRLPYDAEVEFLESTGTQWIDTGVLYSGPCTIRVTAQLTPSIAERDLFGAYDRPSVIGNMVCGIYNSFAFLYNQGGARIDSYNLGSDPVMLTVECDFAYHLRTLIVNGQSYSNNTVFYNGMNITIFRGNTALSANGIFKCYRFSIIRAGVLVRDFIPVRRGTTGYLYDRVSGKLFGNAGTGDFVLGQDK